MNAIDLIIAAIYLAGLFSWAIYIGLKETADDFLVLSRRAPLLLVLFSVISTWVGIGTTMATAASGYEKGISLGLTAASGGLLGVIVAAWFAPRLKKFGDDFKAHTIGDFFAVRYSGVSRMVAASLIFLVYIQLTAAQFVGLATLLEVWTGWQFEVIVWFAALSTVIYTAFAGIKSDFYTDVIHFFVMFIVLFFALLPITWQEIGGVAGLVAELPETYFEPFAHGGPSFFIAGLIFGGGSVFVTMELWQRIYASTSGQSARRALWLSIIIIIMFYMISAFFGMATKIIEPNLINRDQALFILMEKLLPVGLLGLGLAGFMAVFISTVNSTIMVASATLTKDFYKALVKPQISDKELLTAARVATFICGLLGLGFAMILPDIITLSVNALFMLLTLLPSVVFGFFWRRATAIAATSSIIIGFVTMLAFMAFADSETAFVPGFLASTIVFVIVSYFTKSSEYENLDIVSSPQDGL